MIYRVEQCYTILKMGFPNVILSTRIGGKRGEGFQQSFRTPKSPIG